MTDAKALITLLPHESKKLIAVGVTAIDWVREKMKEGKIFVSRGTTNSYVLEEMLAISEFEKNRYVAGQILHKGGRLAAVPSEKRLPEILFINGKSEEMNAHKAMEIMEKDDIIIKGANALDPDGIAGVLIGHPQAGTCGAFWGPLRAKGFRLLIPIGLEKLVTHSILYASMDAGLDQIDFVDGMPIGLFPLYGDVFTEIEALETLFELDEVIHVASGGVGGAEGAVTLMLIGEKSVVKKAFDFCQKLKTIKPFTPVVKE